MVICYYTSVQNHRMYNTKSDPNVNHRLWVILTCQCRFINGYKCTVLVGDVGNYMHVWGQGVHANSVYFLLNFTMHLKPKVYLKGEQNLSYM